VLSSAQVADQAHRAVEAIAAAARRQARAYSRSEHRPLLGYVAIAGAYTAAVAVGALTVRTRGRRLPRISARDVALFGCATFQLSHMLAKQPIASPLHAPFTAFDGVAGPSELHEEVRGDGLRHAVGELLTCSSQGACLWGRRRHGWAPRGVGADECCVHIG
jgi:hypothetical protein